MKLTVNTVKFFIAFIDSSSSLEDTRNIKQSDTCSQNLTVFISRKCQRAQRLTNKSTKHIQISLRDEPAINLHTENEFV